MNAILGELGKSPKFCEYIKNIEQKISPISIWGLNDVGAAQILQATAEFSKKPICIITYNEIQAKQIIENLKYFSDKIVYFPKKEIVTYDYIAESKNLPYERIEALNQKKRKKNLIVVTTIESLMQKIPSKEVLYKNELNFKIGDSYKIEELKQKLIDLGYTRYDLIDGRGQFSVRGGIIDISINNVQGVRIEFWGDEIDSIRLFNIVSQRSTENVEKFTIYPAHEYVLENNIETVCKNIQEKVYSSVLEEKVEEDIEQIKNGNYISKIEKYFDDFYSNQTNLLSYLSEKYLIYIDEISKVRQRAINIAKDNENIEMLLTEKEKIVPEAIRNMYTIVEIEETLDRKQIVYLEKQDRTKTLQATEYNFVYKDKNYFKSEIEALIKDINKAQAEQKNIYILVENKE